MLTLFAATVAFASNSLSAVRLPVVSSSVCMEVKSWYDTKVAEAAASNDEAVFVDTRSSEYVLEQRRKMAESPFGGMKFDFSGTQSVPTPTRGEDGLNEQGYKAPPPSMEKGFPVALLPAVALIGLLTAYNQGML